MSYQNKCCHCGKMFKSDNKRCVSCGCDSADEGSEMTTEERYREALEKIATFDPNSRGVGMNFFTIIAAEALNPPQEFEEVTQECGLVLDCTGGEYLFGTLGAAQGAANNMVGATVYTGTYTYRRPVKLKVKRREEITADEWDFINPPHRRCISQNCRLFAEWEE